MSRMCIADFNAATACTSSPEHVRVQSLTIPYKDKTYRSSANLRFECVARLAVWRRDGASGGCPRAKRLAFVSRFAGSTALADDEGTRSAKSARRPKRARVNLCIG
jgi:hypothetical protein